MEHITVLRNAGLKPSLPRLIIYEALFSSALTFKQLSEVCAARGVSPSTAYRNIDAFLKKGVVHETGTGPGRIIQLASSIPSAHAHHIRCDRCGMIQSFHDEDIERSLRNVAAKHGLNRLVSHTVELSGTCAACARQSISSER